EHDRRPSCPGGSHEEEVADDGHPDAQQQVDPTPGRDVELEGVLAAYDVELGVRQGDQALEGLEDAGDDHDGGREDGQAPGPGALRRTELRHGFLLGGVAVLHATMTLQRGAVPGTRRRRSRPVERQSLTASRTWSSIACS